MPALALNNCFRFLLLVICLLLIEIIVRFVKYVQFDSRSVFSSHIILRRFQHCRIIVINIGDRLGHDPGEHFIDKIEYRSCRAKIEI